MADLRVCRRRALAALPGVQCFQHGFGGAFTPVGGAAQPAAGIDAVAVFEVRHAHSVLHGGIAFCAKCLQSRRRGAIDGLPSRQIIKVTHRQSDLRVGMSLLGGTMQPVLLFFPVFICADACAVAPCQQVLRAGVARFCHPL